MTKKLSKAYSSSTHDGTGNVESGHEQPPDYEENENPNPPDITAGFNNLSLRESAEDSPSIDQCIAHLKLLECFYQLRRQVGSTDGLFGIENKVVTESQAVLKDDAPRYFAKLAEKRWAIFVSRAVDRLESWLDSVEPTARRITCKELKVQGEKGELCEPSAIEQPLELSAATLPPVDVLMVLHAYMLNPRAFLEDCLRYGRMRLWHTGLPLKPIVESINSETFQYEAETKARENFTKATGLPWDLQDDSKGKTVECPTCKTRVEVPLTTCQLYAPSNPNTSLELFSADIDKMLSSGQGYCDKDFCYRCPSCTFEITHEHIRAKKFLSDVESLVLCDVPMRGTVLSIDGVPYRHKHVQDFAATRSMETPNYVIRSLYPNFDEVEHDSMGKIRDLIEKHIRDPQFVLGMYRQSTVRRIRLLRFERVGVRLMMSRYWENSSPFALDLVGAVIRQGSFIEKMHNIDWLHSPALRNTMKRLLLKYQRFVSIMANRSNMAVPTLDVDLAWHTNQLFPRGYMNYTTKVTHQFIDHDDKVPETKLNQAFEWTSKTYQKLYSEPYSECTCWYCEAVRESHTSRASRMFNTGNAKVADKLHRTHTVAQEPGKSVHISTHNAVRPQDDEEYDLIAKQKAQKLEKMYKQACDRARKKGLEPPKRDDYYYSDAWGYPVYLPAYSPYAGFVGFSPLYYPATPGCMALAAGAVGNCCSGTCGAGVAAGSCGGIGGGCAGAAPAGCGGGGGGGCGGGGGGGGGGCGGGGGA